ncbi:DUF692 domain-containing protein [Tautonia sp. JC769]|uniref:DUF692 domain-containing protein n=1 Tax=Tautonia sp. JC769 TaxID=3232135 RepID=UPI0034581126
MSRTIDPDVELGLGLGWRPELAWLIERHRGLGFVEVIAEGLDPEGPLPAAMERLRERGVRVVPHGISLSIGGAGPLDRSRLAALATLATRLEAPVVSEHVAFVRAGGVEAGHLLPVPRSPKMLDLLVDRVRRVQDALPVPLALENVSTLVEWPEPVMGEAEFLAELLDRTGALLLLDVANIYANARNHGGDAIAFLDALPLDRIAYVHLGGGVDREGFYHDTHAHPVPAPVFGLLEELSARGPVPGALLERDDRFPTDDAILAELDAIRDALDRGRSRGPVDGR